MDALPARPVGAGRGGPRTARAADRRGGGIALAVAFGHRRAGARRGSGDAGRDRQGRGHELRAIRAAADRRSPRVERRGRARLAASDPRVSRRDEPGLFAARRHARDHPRHHRPRPGAALMIDALLREQFARTLDGVAPANPWPAVAESGFLDLLAPAGAGLTLEALFDLAVET